MGQPRAACWHSPFPCPIVRLPICPEIGTLKTFDYIDRQPWQWTGQYRQFVDVPTWAHIASAKSSMLRYQVEPQLDALPRISGKVKPWVTPCPSAIAAECRQCLPIIGTHSDLHLAIVRTAEVKPVPKAQPRILINRRHNEPRTNQTADCAISVVAR